MLFTDDVGESSVNPPGDDNGEGESESQDTSEENIPVEHDSELDIPVEHDPTLDEFIWTIRIKDTVRKEIEDTEIPMEVVYTQFNSESMLQIIVRVEEQGSWPKDKIPSEIVPPEKGTLFGRFTLEIMAVKTMKHTILHLNTVVLLKKT